MDKKINNGLLIGSTLITLSDCNKAPLHLFKNIFNPIISLVKELSKNNKSDLSGLEHFKTDTIKVDKESLKNPEHFLKRLQEHGLNVSGKVITGSQIKYDYGMNYNGKIGMGWHIKCKYSHKYLPNSIKLKVKNEVFATKEEDSFFVCVDFYGKRNPEVAARHYEV